ncbi:uncharacterized protein LOC119091893 [Pollicipes pollicipes]|uniref:uncharacterized protein LOC119091893 n=1 Tax=Pollicipes pollicipes TaxID=41117 RepID=UPI001885468E|nr:uncharacterized protein LOC119091893 [Pollicipes pollicipes]
MASLRWWPEFAAVSMLLLTLLWPDAASATSSTRACVHVRGLGDAARNECVDISESCRRRRCPADTLCALAPDLRLTCLPGVAGRLRNCAPEPLRLAQPCPANTVVLGFGQGCTFCAAGAAPNASAPPPALTLRPQPGGRSQPRRACVTVCHARGGVRSECFDVSVECDSLNCPIGTKCVLRPDGEYGCLPESAYESANCGSEEMRLSQPCPANSVVAGFGQGCTFCTSNNATDPPSTASSSITASASQEHTQNACVVAFNSSRFSVGECFDITSHCVRKGCSSDTVCGFNLKGAPECFPASVTAFQNCGPDKERLVQPCPADAGVLGFGAGCTFCVAGYPVGPVSRTEPAPIIQRGAAIGPKPTLAPEPTTGPGPGVSPKPETGPELRVGSVTGITLGPPIQDVARSARALSTAQEQSANICITIHSTSKGAEKKCREVSAACELKQCRPGTLCGVSMDDVIGCFTASVQEFEPCRMNISGHVRPCAEAVDLSGPEDGCSFRMCGGSLDLTTSPPGGSTIGTFELHGASRGRGA